MCIPPYPLDPGPAPCLPDRGVVLLIVWCSGQHLIVTICGAALDPVPCHHLGQRALLQPVCWREREEPQRFGMWPHASCAWLCMPVHACACLCMPGHAGLNAVCLPSMPVCLASAPQHSVCRAIFRIACGVWSALHAVLSSMGIACKYGPSRDVALYSLQDTACHSQHAHYVVGLCSRVSCLQ